MFITPEGKEIFVVDGHTHFWDGSPENQRNIHGKQFVECFYAYHTALSPKEQLWPKAKFEKYSADDLYRDLFVDGPDAGKTADERDRAITQMGDRVGVAFLVIGGVVGIALCAIDAAPFWIANTLYAGFALSSVVGGIARVVAYRRGLEVTVETHHVTRETLAAEADRLHKLYLEMAK